MEFVIPEELLANILVRLHIKDIFRSKLVCKSWLRLISDPYFRINCAKNSPFTLIFRATVSYHDDPHKLSLSLFEFAHGKEYTQIPLLTPKIPDHRGPNSLLSFIGSCDCSVFILHLHKPFANDHAINRVYSFNPVSGSRVVKLVAEERIRTWDPTRKYMVGFIPSNSTHKLVRFDPRRKKAENTEIFTVGGSDENWRKVDDDPLLFCGAWPYEEGLVCLNGAYHWLSYSEYYGDARIFTFDLLQEKMGTAIPTPHGAFPLSRVTILNGRLSLIDLFKNDDHLTIWTMEEYGVVESWSKVAVLRLCDHDHHEWRYYNLVLIAVLANGDILFADKSIKGMCFYNFQDKRFTQIDHLDASRSYRIYENTYVPRFYT